MRFIHFCKIIFPPEMIGVIILNKIRRFFVAHKSVGGKQYIFFENTERTFGFAFQYEFAEFLAYQINIAQHRIPQICAP